MTYPRQVCLGPSFLFAAFMKGCESVAFKPVVRRSTTKYSSSIPNLKLCMSNLQRLLASCITMNCSAESIKNCQRWLVTLRPVFRMKNHRKRKARGSPDCGSLDRAVLCCCFHHQAGSQFVNKLAMQRIHPYAVRVQDSGQFSIRYDVQLLPYPESF